MAAQGASVGRGISKAAVAALLAMLVAAAVLAALTVSLFSTGASPRVHRVTSFDTRDRTGSIRVSHYGRTREDWMDSIFGGEAIGPPSLADLLAKKE